MRHRPESPQERRRADRRFQAERAMGLAQTMAAISTLFLLAAKGLGRPTIAAGLFTLVLTGLSLILFGRHSPPAPPQRGEVRSAGDRRVYA